MGGNTSLNDILLANSTPQTPDTERYQQSASTAPKRKAPCTHARCAAVRRGSPTRFVLRSEEEVNRPLTTPPVAVEDSTYGVRSLDTTVSSLDQSTLPDDASMSSGSSQNDITPHAQHRDLADSLFFSPSPHPESDTSAPSSPQSYRSSPIIPLSREPSSSALSGPLTPYHLRSPHRISRPGSCSTPRSSSLRSLRLSDDDATTDVSSQAVHSSDDEAHDSDAMEEATPLPAQDLIMPSVTMPKRRPFTERGERVGKLKIAVSGRPNTGKTSLIRAIVQCCEDIIHVDPALHTDFMEITHASTRSLPLWWSKAAGKRPSNRRRQSGNLNEPVLERNITFIDSNARTLSDLVDYCQNLLRDNMDLARMDEDDLLSIFSGHGGMQVDLVLYTITSHVDPEDLETLAELSKLTSVIPVLTETDTMSEDTIKETLSAVRDIIRCASVEIFDLTNQGSSAPAVWAVSTASADHDVIDASVLMDAEYVPPLKPSMLPALISHIFDPDNAAQMRHISSQKFLAWRRCQSGSNRSEGRLQPSALESPTRNKAADEGASKALTRLDQIQHVKREPQSLHIARWAADLQRSFLKNYNGRDKTTSNARADWAVEKRNEKIDDEKDVEAQTSRKAPLRPRDPLGLLSWNDSVTSHTRIIFRVLSGCGILGAIAIWAMKNWSYLSNEDWSSHWRFGWLP